jgi:hypothetical protein
MGEVESRYFRPRNGGDTDAISGDVGSSGGHLGGGTWDDSSAVFLEQFGGLSGPVGAHFVSITGTWGHHFGGTLGTILSGAFRNHWGGTWVPLRERWGTVWGARGEYVGGM